jgi:hypothetical protein
MSKGIKRAACGVALLTVSGYAADAFACGANETEAYKSAYTVWCIDSGSAGGAQFPPFFKYGDAVVQELEKLFAVTPTSMLPLTIEASAHFQGGAQTPSNCCGFGEGVSLDAYSGNSYGVDGFWGYLLTLHELVNQWTGLVSSGWPTDFWADHVSAFPNSMDWHIMQTLGNQLGQQNLVAASAAQKARFYPMGDSADPRVPMFDDIFALPSVGFDGLARVFALVQADHLSWDNLGVANPDPKRTEYVVAYLSLGAGKPVTSILQAAHVGDGTPDGKGDPGYTLSESNVDAIANGHCAIAAAKAQGGSVSGDLGKLRSGDFSGITAAGKCGAGCPAECGCKSSTDRCVAPWLGDPKAGGADGGGGMTGDDGGGLVGGDGGAVGGGPDGGSGGSGNGGTGGTGSSSGCALGGSQSGGVWLAAIALAGLALARGRRRR